MVKGYPCQAYDQSPSPEPQHEHRGLNVLELPGEDGDHGWEEWDCQRAGVPQGREPGGLTLFMAFSVDGVAGDGVRAEEEWGSGDEEHPGYHQGRYENPVDSALKI